IEVTPVSSTAERISQVVYQVQNNQKTSLLIHLLQDPEITRSLVFTRTKRDANRVSESLCAAGIGAAAIHGNKSQGARERALASIKEGKTRVLVATDIAARGIDIDGVSHVFNFDIPNVPESYVHRIGRTARAGKEGVGISFCSSEERQNLGDIERLIRKRLPIAKTPEGLQAEVKRKSRFSGQNSSRPQSRNGGGNGGSGQRNGNSRKQGSGQRSQPRY
ncbi:MAG: C-terminal helicase domain-containing protein, partial [Bdellovibrionia bacterium]